MTDNRIKDRVKVMLNGTTSPDISAAEPPRIAVDPGPPNQALHVLTMAQRTADEHVNNAHRHADQIRAEAQAMAEQIARDARTHAESVRREADSVLAEARTIAEQSTREAQTRVADAQRSADQIVSEARAKAEGVLADAEQAAKELQVQAQRRYDDVVGGLGVKREALQEQIEALERFDHEYRARLTTFMQGQLRALWVDRPQVTGELPGEGPEIVPAHAAPEPAEGQVAVPLQRESGEPANA